MTEHMRVGGGVRRLVDGRRSTDSAAYRRRFEPYREVWRDEAERAIVYSKYVMLMTWLEALS